MKKLFLGFFIALLIGLIGVGYSSVHAENNKSKDSLDTKPHEDPEGFYYTCPMHPQVHEHKPGKCPICGMPLVKKSSATSNIKLNSDSEIQVSTGQLNLAGVGKYTVVRKDLTFSVPVSGRFLSSREVVFQVFESDLSLLKSGVEFSGSPSSSPDEVLKGQIRSVDNLVDPSSRTVRVTGTLGRTPQRFIIEGGFNGEILAKEKSQIAIPEQAVLHTGEGDRIYVFSGDNKLKAQSVTLGKRAGDEYQVLSGLNEGDVISTGPNFLIDSEAKIRGGQ